MPRFDRILVVRTDRLGDVVLTLPMLPLLRTRYPHSHIALLLSRYTGEIVEGNPYADEVVWYDDGRALIPFGAMLRILRKRRFDVVVLVRPTPRLAWLMALARIPVRIGTGYRYYSFLFNRRVFEHRKDAVRHELEYNLNLLRELDCPVPAEGFRPEFVLRIPDEDSRNVRRLMKERGVDASKATVVVHPGSGGSAHEWPAEHFGELARRLIAGLGLQIVVTGVRGEESKIERVVSSTGGKAVPMVGILTVKELAALIGSASLFVSNSTGPLHIAAALGTPVLAFYPQIVPMSVRRWGPYTDKKRVFVPDKPLDCRDCTDREDGYCACMASIGVDKAYDAARELLASATVH